MKLILFQATFAISITEIHFASPFRCQIEQQHLDFAVGQEQKGEEI